MFLFFMLMYEIKGRVVCVIDSDPSSSSFCPFDDAEKVAETEFNDFIFSNEDELEVYVCCDRLIVNALKIARRELIIFTSIDSSKILFYENKENSASFSKLSILNLSVETYDMKVIIEKEVRLENVTFLNKSLKIETKTIFSDMMSIRNIGVIVARSKIVIDTDFTKFIPCLTRPTVYSPNIFHENLNENVTLEIAGQGFSIISDEHPEKNFTFYQSNIATNCVFENMKKKGIGISIVNMFISTRLRKFSIIFNATTDVYFNFLKCTWSGDIKSRFSINQENSNAIIDSETNSIPLKITGINSSILFNVNNLNVDVIGEVSLNNSEMMLTTKMNNNNDNIPSVHFDSFFLKDGCSLIIKDSIKASIEQIKSSSNAEQNNTVKGSINAYELICFRGTTCVDELAITGPKITTNIFDAYLFIHKLHGKDVLYIDFSSTNVIESDIESKNVLHINEYTKDTRFYSILNAQKAIKGNKTYSIVLTLDAIEFVDGNVYLMQEEESMIFDDVFCIIENETTDTSFCPKEYHVITSSDFDSASIVIPDKSTPLSFFVVGDVSVSFYKQSFAGKSFIIEGITNELSSIHINCNEFNILHLTNITAAFDLPDKLKVNSLFLCRSKLENLTEYQIASFTTTLDDFARVNKSRIAELNINTYEKTVVNTTNDSIMINGCNCTADIVRISLYNESRTDVNIYGTMAQNILLLTDRNQKIHVNCYYRIDSFTVPSKSICTFNNVENIPKEIINTGTLNLSQLDYLKFHKLVITESCTIATNTKTNIYVDIIEFRQTEFSHSISKNAVIHAQTVVLENVSGSIINGIHNATVYIIDMFSTCYIRVPKTETIEKIKFIIKYQMVSVPFVSLASSNCKHIDIVMNNTGGSNQLISDNRWEGIKVNILNVNSHNVSVDPVFVSSSWAFNAETRLFDLSPTVSSNYETMSTYSIVRRKEEEQIITEKHEENSFNVIIIAAISISIIIILTIIIVVVIRKRVQAKKLRNFYDQSTIQESLVDIS